MTILPFDLSIPRPSSHFYCTTSTVLEHSKGLNFRLPSDCKMDFPVANPSVCARRTPSSTLLFRPHLNAMAIPSYNFVSRQKLTVIRSSSVGNLQRCKSNLETLFCYDKSIPEEKIEKPIGLSLEGRAIGNSPPCFSCETKGAVLCATCSGSGLYVDAILESQGVIVKVRCLGCGGTGNIMCSSCGGRGHV